MSLYSSLTQVLAPFAAKINGLLTGWDGTRYTTPGEAVRQQISDLHVLIGDVPGAAIQASAVAYNDSNVAAELTNVNGRLREQQSALSAVEEKVPVVDAVAENYTEVKPDNWHNVETDTAGILNADGTTVESTTRFHTDYIAVIPGDVVRVYISSSHNRGYAYNVTYYDSTKTVMPSAGRDTSILDDITVPEGAAYIRLTLSISFQTGYIITINLEPTDWSIQYFAPYYVLSQDMITDEYREEVEGSLTNVSRRLTEQQDIVMSLAPRVPVMDAVAESYSIVNPDNWHNVETDTVGILKADGTVVEATNRFYTGYIAVAPGDVIRAYSSANHNKVYFFNYTYYDSDKTVIPSAGRDTSGSYDITVPDGAAYIRLTFDLSQQSGIIITINLVPTNWSIQYFDPYYTLTSDMVTEESETAIENAKSLKSGTVRGTNLVTEENTHIGMCYWGSNNIVVNESETTYRYVVVPLKQNTRYIVNVNCRFYIFTDDSDNRISSGSTSLGKLFFDSGSATKLYYTVAKNNYDNGLIITEGYSGTLANVVKPTFLDGLNQLMFDSWFAVALPPRTIRFTVGISEKLYYYNILALSKNMIDLSLGTVKDAEGVTVTANSQVIESNAYGYTVYDDNLSVVANAPRGGQNRLTICTDNVQDCSALIIGDSIIARNSGVIGQTMLDAWTERQKTLTLLGTLGTGDNKNEGRPGWTVADYFSNKTYEGVVNPFYNPTSETFDFSYYMSNAGYSAVDYVCIHLGGNDLFSIPFSEAREKITRTEELLCAMIDSILTFNASQKIIIQLAPTTSPKWDAMNAVGGNPALIRAKFNVFNAEMFVILTKYSSSNVRISNDYMIVDPNNDLADHIHPNNTGLAKIGMELLSQINCWQAGH